MKELTIPQSPIFSRCSVVYLLMLLTFHCVYWNCTSISLLGIRRSLVDMMHLWSNPNASWYQFLYYLLLRLGLLLYSEAFFNIVLLFLNNGTIPLCRFSDGRVPGEKRQRSRSHFFQENEAAVSLPLLHYKGLFTPNATSPPRSQVVRGCLYLCWWPGNESHLEHMFVWHRQQLSREIRWHDSYGLSIASTVVKGCAGVTSRMYLFFIENI